MVAAMVSIERTSRKYRLNRRSGRPTNGHRMLDNPSGAL